MKVLYTASATAEGGRNGKVATSDGALALDLTVPSKMNGPGGEGTNPEQLFAAGYAACFSGTLEMLTQKAGEDPSGASVTAEVGIGAVEGGRFALAVTLAVHLPSVAPDAARQLAERAHVVCPYSNATRGNVPVTLEVR